MNVDALVARYRDLQAYVGWTDADADRMRPLRAMLQPCFPELIDDFYREIARHPDARRVITGGEGQIARLKGSLHKWLSELFSGEYDAAYVARRWAVGWRHVEIGLDQLYTNAALSRLRTGLLGALRGAWTGDPDELLRTLESLQKLLDLDLAIIEDAYQAEHTRRLRQLERQAAMGQVQLAEESRLRTEERLRVALMNAPIIVAYVDRDLRYAWIHSADPQFDPAAILGKRDEQLLPPNEANAWASLKREVMETKSGIRREMTATMRGGTRTFDVTVEPMHDAGGAVIGVTMAAMDVTERKRTEDLLRNADRLASIGTLAAGLGHDMNNVLLPVRARLEALDAAQLPAKAKEHFAAVRQSIAYLQQLSDGLHLLALDPDDTSVSAMATNIGEWWGQVGSLIRKAVPKRVAFDSEFPSELPEIAVPPHRLTQAVLNLVVNAAEAIRDKGQVRLGAARGDDDEHVKIWVADTGEGMTPEVKRHALDPFFTTKKRGLGTGLGLSLVHGVTKAAAGTVEIDSEPGRGTSVTLLFPIAHPSDEAGETAAGHPSRLAAVSVADRRVASFIGSLLAAAGYGVKRCTGDGDAEGTRIWIVDSSQATPQSVKSYLRGNRSRRVLLLGQPQDEYIDLGASFIEDSLNFDAMRLAITDAVQND